MKFILETPEEKTLPTFEDVDTNQFFVTLDGELCQKIGYSSYNMITLRDGTPYADHFSDCHGFVINHVLPKVLKIEF